MTVLSVARHGAWVHLREGRLLVEHKGSVLESVPVDHVEAVRCYGAVQVSTALITHCLREGVELAFFAAGGRFQGRLEGLRGAGAARRVAQYASVLDAEQALHIARGFVEAKLERQRARILRWRRSPHWPARPETVQRFDAAVVAARRAGTLDALRGAEGAAARLYFAELLAALSPGTPQPRRVHPRASDPANALLNLGYSLLTAEGTAAMASAGLDPYLGWLHAPRPGRPSGALDLIEPFRPVAVDPVVLWLLRRGVIGAADFAPSASGLRLTALALPSALRAFERRMQASARGDDGYRRPLRQSLVAHARTLAAVLVERR